MNIHTDGFHNPMPKKKRNKGRQAVRVLIGFPSDFLTNVDALAELEGRSRSELVREALRAYMSKKEVTA
jgi:metal-responsive CopG/Arc/MetJ family transcriptional regulator